MRLILFPNLPVDDQYPVPTTSGLGLGLWYRIDTDTPFSGEAQTMSFSADATDANQFAVSLINRDESVREVTHIGNFARHDVEDNNAGILLAHPSA